MNGIKIVDIVSLFVTINIRSIWYLSTSIKYENTAATTWWDIKRIFGDLKNVSIQNISAKMRICAKNGI